MPYRARRWVAGNSDVKGYGNGVPPLSPGHEWHLAPSPASTVVACFSRGHKFGLTLARLPDLPGAISLHLRIATGGSMRQQTKPFIVERRPTRKPKPDAQKPSIWGRLDADIAQGLKDEQDEDHAVATGGDNRD
ncbi:hypothetical protein ACTOV4_21145 [Brucella sp. C7-11G]